MNVLVFDTATRQVGVAVGRDGEVRGELRLARGRRHAEDLAPAIRRLSRDLDLDLEHLAAIGVGIGPGLFTGLRVGIATAKLLAQVLVVPVVGISSLDLVAAPLRHSDRTICATLDARRGEVFWALYRPVPGGVQRLGPAQVGPPREVAAELEARRERILFAGDGARAAGSVLLEAEHAEWAGAAFDAPSPAALVELVTARVEREEFERAEALRPIYLREADTAINWERRAS